MDKWPRNRKDPGACDFFETHASEGDMNPNPMTESRWIPVSILLGTGIFLLALAVSAAIVPQLRLLHAFQALIYLVVIFLTRRNSAWGFGAGVIIATAWNILNLFVTHLLYAGAGQLWILL